MEKKNTGLLVLVVISILLVLCLGGYVVYDKVIVKENPKQVIEDPKQNIDDVKPIITKEEAATFLNELVDDSVSDDLLISNSDEEVFINSIKYLVLKEKYTKENDKFIFSLLDIKNLARKYYMKDNFEYINNDSKFVYDSSNQTIYSELNFGLFGIGPSIKKTKSIVDFNYDKDIDTATLTYNVKVAYDEVLADPEDRTYNIKLIKVNEELRIKEIAQH